MGYIYNVIFSGSGRVVGKEIKHMDGKFFITYAGHRIEVLVGSRGFYTKETIY